VPNGVNQLPNRKSRNLHKIQVLNTHLAFAILITREAADASLPYAETATDVLTPIQSIKAIFADPFVLGAPGVYYAIGTGAKEAEGQVDEIADAVPNRSLMKCVFPLLRSTSLPGVPVTLLRPDPPSAITS